MEYSKVINSIEDKLKELNYKYNQDWEDYEKTIEIDYTLFKVTIHYSIEEEQIKFKPYISLIKTEENIDMFYVTDEIVLIERQSTLENAWLIVEQDLKDLEKTIEGEEK